MNTTDDFAHVHVIIVGDFPGARHRAGRTLRFLKRRFQHVTDALDFNGSQLSDLLATTDAPLWSVRAGAIPSDLFHWHLPHYPTGTAFCGFGLCKTMPSANTPRANAGLRDSLQREYGELAQQCSEWEALQSESGGDFSSLNGFADQAPTFPSILLSPAFCRTLAQFKNETPLQQRIRSALAACIPRCVRLPHLDVRCDPALRIAQAVTSLQRGGAERIALDLTRELPRHGVRPLFFALGSPTRGAFDPPEEWVEFAPGRNRAEHLRHFAARAISLGCDAVHAHLLSASDMGIVAESGLPIVATIHNSKQGWPPGFTAANATISAHMLIACSQAVERDIRAAKYEIPVRTVWNGIDAGAFDRSPETEQLAREWRAKLELPADDFVLLSLANPRPQKRLELLPAVLAALQQEFRQRGIPRKASLIVAGEAARSSDDAKRCEAALRAEIDRLALTDSVRVIGAVEQVAPLLLASDALVSVSEWEGLSLAHLEALAAGCPVVATDAGGTSEIARENPALTVVPLNATPEFIAAKLAAIAEDKPATAARGRSSFTLHCMAERYAFLYPSAIEQSCLLCAADGVWLIANNFTTGGAQSSARRLLLGLYAQNVSVRAAVLQERDDHPTPGLSALRAAGVPVFIPEPRSPDPLDAVTQILEQIAAHRPRAILFWNVIAEHKILLADALIGVPIFDVSPGEMFFDSLDLYFATPRPGLPYRTPAEYAARLAGMVVKYSAEALRAKKSLGIKPHVIPNGLPLNTAPMAVKRSSNDRFVIGTSARISPQKKLDELIRALRLAAPHLPPHVLKIAGRPESGGDAYAQSLQEMGAGLNIEWIGEFQNAAEFLAGLDLFAMISEPAGCPNASLEAMAAGLPVIATDHGGASEQVVDGVTGRLVPRADAEAFAAALIELGHDPERRAAYGTAGRARVEAFFSVDRMVSDYRRLCGV